MFEVSLHFGGIWSKYCAPPVTWRQRQVKFPLASQTRFLVKFSLESNDSQTFSLPKLTKLARNRNLTCQSAKMPFDKLNSCLMGFGALHLLLYSNHSKIVMSATKISISKVETAMRHQRKITTFFNDSEFSHQIPIGHH